MHENEIFAPIFSWLRIFLHENVILSYIFSCINLFLREDILHKGTPNCQQVFWAWMQRQVPGLTTKRSFDSQATWVIGVLGLFFDMFITGVFTIWHWQTGAGIKCLYCIVLYCLLYLFLFIFKESSYTIVR